LPNHTKVILFSLSSWLFFDYGDDIESWYLGLSEEGRDVLDAMLKANSKADTPQQWTGCKMLQGEPKEPGIWEWRFFADDRQQRLLGIFGERRKTAIFLIGCSHKQGVYQPAECMDTAIRRAKEVRNGRTGLGRREVRSNI
jgi:hypothetical protein